MNRNNPIPYQQGRKASIRNQSDPKKATNPYPRYSEAWEDWNLGWNSDESLLESHKS